MSQLTHNGPVNMELETGPVHMKQALVQSKAIWHGFCNASTNARKASIKNREDFANDQG